MRQSRRQTTAAGVSLFPFLAVLICTMGALIVLLVLVVQLARVNASDGMHDDPLLPQKDELEIAKEDLQWHRELLETQRDELRVGASDRRLKLSHLEEHIRELEQQWQLLRQAAADLKKRQLGDQDDTTAAREQLAQLQQQIDAAEDELELARERAAEQPPVYAIVPYEGRHGTHRRPVYIECREDSVVIQPEGVVLTSADFSGPMGPGNPLDSALRAIREYYARLAPSQNMGDPYPLLVVRPGGVESYAAARTAMRSWDDEFGYELVDESMELKYPERDPQLAQLLTNVTANARSRQSILAAAMPSQYGKGGNVGYVASSSGGGFVAQGGRREPPQGSRTGGFGQGGDSRYIDGYASGPVDGPAPPEELQSVGGPQQQGHALGRPDAQIGGGCAPLAEKRGQNWGLPGAHASATGIVRPIRLAVLPDRLILLPARGERQVPEVVLIDGAMTDEIDQFVSKIWDRIDQWGIAVAGGYWKPELRAYVAQGGDERFLELQTLLRGSGLEVQRSSNQ